MNIERSGSGDIDISLRLLWKMGDKPKRGRKPGITLESIVSTAVAVADAEGLEAVSMRRVATELGVGTMSLYRHVPGKAELVDLMLDTVAAESSVAPEGRGWRAALEHLARQTWAMYERHPWAAAAYTRPVLGPHVIDGYEALLAALADTGLSPGDVVNAAELVGHYVDGAARRAAEEADVQRRTTISDEEWWAAREPFWERYFDVERYPTITAMYEAGAFEARAEAFEFGLQRVLDGIESYLEKSGEALPPSG
jgi:AcrR family transcriptional regulator